MVAMNHGLYFPNFGHFGDASVVAQWAARAEAAGWHGFFIWDHIARPFVVDVVDPCVALAAAAVATRRLRLGALVTPLPRRRPQKFARESASLDRLSDGRLVVGVGTGSAGGADCEWADFGEEPDAKKRGAMLDEALEVVTGLWRGGPFSFEGRYYRAREAHFLPTPAQSPRIPIWVGGYWSNRAPLRRAARYDGVFPLLRGEGGPARQLRALVDRVRQERQDLGLASAPFDVVYPTASPVSDPLSLETLAEVGVTWRLAMMDPPAFGGSWTRWPLAAMTEFVDAGPPAR